MTSSSSLDGSNVLYRQPTPTTSLSLAALDFSSLNGKSSLKFSQRNGSVLSRERGALRFAARTVETQSSRVWIGVFHIY